jgi:hypothetical protein
MESHYYDPLPKAIRLFVCVLLLILFLISPFAAESLVSDDRVVICSPGTLSGVNSLFCTSPR